MHKIIRFLVGAVLGALMATAMVLLITPVRGDELRNRLIKLFHRVADEIREAGDQKKAELEAEIKKLNQPAKM